MPLPDAIIAHRVRVRRGLWAAAERARRAGETALTFEERALDDNAVRAAYLGAERVLEREVDALVRMVWRIR